jgi:hypothetical protein
MYTNIPTSELPRLITKIYDHQNITKQTKQELLLITKTIIKQNYFCFQNHIYKQRESLGMCAPTSAIFSEIYLHYIEHTSIFDILTQNNIHGYFRYVDDILLVYDIELTNIHNVLKQFNTVSPKLTFTLEEEREKQLHFLDITIIREQKQFTFNIYRKPTITDHIIPKDSCHPHEHKASAIQYLTNRMESYPIENNNKLKENQIIQHILQANKYNHNLPHPNRLKRRQQNQTESMQPKNGQLSCT